MKWMLPTILLLTVVLGCGSKNSGETGGPSDPMIVVSDRQVIESDGSYNGFPGIVQAANGDWVLSYKKGINHVTMPSVILRRSQDHGQTWSPEVVAFNSSVNDPTLALMPNGQLLLEFPKPDSNGIVGAAYSLSSDNGATWGPFTFLSNPPSDTAVLPTAFVTDGGNVYAASYGPHGDGTNDPAFWKTADSGVTWTKVSVIRQPGDVGINETSIAEISPGKFIAISRDDVNPKTWAHISNDFGQTWSAQIDYTPQVGGMGLPQLLQVTNALLLFGRQDDTTPSPPAHEMVVYASYDGGTTFTDRTLLDTYTGLGIDGGYCWPLLQSDGSVFLVYYADSNNLRQPDIKSLVVRVSEFPNPAFGGIPRSFFSYSPDRLARVKTKKLYQDN